MKIVKDNKINVRSLVWEGSRAEMSALQGQEAKMRTGKSALPTGVYRLGRKFKNGFAVCLLGAVLSMSGCVSGSRNFSQMDTQNVMEAITVQETTRAELVELLGPPQREGIRDGLLANYWHFQIFNPLFFQDQRGFLRVEFDQADRVVDFNYHRSH